MNDSLTLSSFLEQSGAQVTIFDMGRRVVEIPLDTVRNFELAEIAYPLPFLQSAWLGILFQYPDKKNNNSENNHNIWFIKLPLDEQGLIQQAARDDFLHRMLETMAEALKNESQHQSLDDNPYGFTPREDRMAVFHAKIAKKIGDAASQYYEHARDYFSGKAGYEQWNFVGLQGIADVAARLEENGNEQILIQAISQLPSTPFAALCSCLENSVPSEGLTKEISSRINQAIEDDDAVIVAAGIRGLSNSKDRDTNTETIRAVLNRPVGKNVEVLAAIAGRDWETLENSEIRKLFLESLAACDAGQQAFNGILSDLLFLPGLRQLIKDEFRSTSRSKKLANAIGAFLSSVQSQTDNP